MSDDTPQKNKKINAGEGGFFSSAFSRVFKKSIPNEGDLVILEEEKKIEESGISNNEKTKFSAKKLKSIMRKDESKRVTTLQSFKNSLLDIVSGSTKNLSSDTDVTSEPRIKKSVKFEKHMVVSIHPAPSPSSNFEKPKDISQIISNYLSACQKAKIKPAEHLIDDLNNLKHDSIKLEKIDFKSVKIDYRQAECLEEIFKNIKSEWIDFTNAVVDDEAAISLFEIIEYYESAKRIFFVNNVRVGIRGWFTITQYLSKSSELTFLDLSKNIFTDQIIHLLVRGIRSATSLKTIRLENCYLNGARLKSILGAVAFNQNLKELYLGENKISSSDGQYFSDLFKLNDTLQIIDLRNNSLQDLGVLKIAEGLSYQINPETGLEVLHLWNNYITSTGFMYLKPVLKYHPNLHTINMGRNKIEDGAIIDLKMSLIKNTSLLRLGLSSNKLTNQGAIALAEVIADSRNIMRIDVRNNNFSIAGLIALSQAVQLNYSLFKLDFDSRIEVESDLAEFASKIIEEIKLCSIRNRQLAKGGTFEDVMSINTMLSDEHSITQSIKTEIPFSSVIEEHNLGFTSGFWQLLSKFTRKKTQNKIVLNPLDPAEEFKETINDADDGWNLVRDNKLTDKNKTILNHLTYTLEDDIDQSVLIFEKTIENEVGRFKIIQHTRDLDYEKQYPINQQTNYYPNSDESNSLAKEDVIVDSYNSSKNNSESEIIIHKDSVTGMKQCDVKDPLCL